MRTSVYVDGFNLYYGQLKSTRLKWLNPLELVRSVVQKHHVIDRLRYFTADVKPRPDKPTTHVRQQVYLRALKTLPEVEIHKGRFLTKTKKMPLAVAPPNGSRVVEVLSTEEKGSDVALATNLLVDAYEKTFEAAIIVSNDSDLVPAIEKVVALGLRVGVLNPHAKPSVELQKAASFQMQIHSRTIAKCQFPHQMADAQGNFHCPQEWMPAPPRSSRP